MNKKGFATSTIVFALLSVFLISISILLVTITNTNRTKNALNEKVVSNIEYGNSSINDIEQRLEELEKNTLKLDNVYPVGSVYISTTDDTIEKVQNKLGGKWKKYAEGTSLISAGTYTDKNGNISTYTSGTTGGSNVSNLAVDNLPAHTHTVTAKGTVSSTFTGTAVTSSGISADHQHYFSATTSTNGSHTHVLNAYGQDFVVPSGLGSGLSFANNGSGGTTKGHWFTGSFLAAANGDHAHTVSGWTGGASSNHTHTVTAAGTVSSKFTGTSATTSSTGTGKSFSVQNTYTVVYMYERIND